MKNLLFIITIVFGSSTIFAQVSNQNTDTVLKRSGEEVFGKVTEITTGYIVCQITDSVQVVNQIILLDDIFMITYANGTRELIPQTKPLEKEISIPTFTPKQMYRKGQEDANLYYKGNGAFWSTATSTTLFPPVGLVVGVIAASTPINMENQKVSDVIFLNDRNYVNGYKKQARKKKAKKTLAGFGAAAGVYVIGFMLIGL